MKRSRKQVFYADGERISTGVVEAALSRLDVKVTRFDGNADCLESVRTRECHLLLSNPQKPSMEGLGLLAESRQIAPSLPIILLVDHGDIRTAVCAMKAGATDCLERPPETHCLTSVIDAALRDSVVNAWERRNPLSQAEEQVLHLILHGQTSSDIAETLHRSRRTIEVHRSHIMRKLDVDSMVDLVRRCARMGLLRDWP